ncbi:MAG: hypothetical protein ABIE07_13405 [Candidatus Zixiibacteriota bacterium]
MGRSKSPVDELVDGIDAIGSILDESLPNIKSRLDNLTERHIDSSQSITEIKRVLKEAEEIQSDLKKSVTNLDIKLEEIMGTINSVTRRMDQLQKSILDLTVLMDHEIPLGSDSGLADAVKTLEDRLNKIEGKRFGQDDFKNRF